MKLPRIHFDAVKHAAKDAMAGARSALAHLPADLKGVAAHVGDDAAHAEHVLLHLGEEGAKHLEDLAKEAALHLGIGGPKVLFVPGLTHTMLGPPNQTVTWLNPASFVLGHFTHLAYGQPIVPHSLLPLHWYLILKLRIAGYDATSFHYDWRGSMATCGEALAAHLAKLGPDVSIVAHSYGGMVTRAALATGRAKNVRRAILIGSPHFGAFELPMALRGVDPLIRMLSYLDPKHSPEDLARDIVGTWPSFYELIPSHRVIKNLDFRDPAVWPKTGVQVRLDRLAAHASALDALPLPTDERFRLIVGIEQDTTTGARLEGGEFTFEYTKNGDGTVARDLAEVPGARCYFIPASHKGLIVNSKVLRAVLDLLAHGDTDVLPTSAPHLSGGYTKSEAELRTSKPPGLMAGVREAIKEKYGAGPADFAEATR
jgi:pimeloyl-ACP methyl ester carboxylesterase